MNSMMRILASFFLLLFCSLSVQGQDIVDNPRRNKAVFIELFGNGIGGTVNFDTRLAKGAQGGHGIRVGIGGYPNLRNVDVLGNSNTASLISLPISYNYLLGRRRSAFEAGAGVTPIFSKVRATRINGTTFEETDATVAGFANIGYRYQPIHSGFVFRFTWTPALTNEGFFPSWFGISFGYGFK